MRAVAGGDVGAWRVFVFCERCGENLAQIDDIALERCIEAVAECVFELGLGEGHIKFYERYVVLMYCFRV